MIINYIGQIIGDHVGGVDSYAAAPINIEAVREWRTNGMSAFRELRIEQYGLIYKAAEEAMGGIYPKNLGMDQLPLTIPEAWGLRGYITNKLVENGVWTPPTGWKPYEVPKEVIEKVKRAAERSG